jgi:hypothetical protein
MNGLVEGRRHATCSRKSTNPRVALLELAGIGGSDVSCGCGIFSKAHNAALIGMTFDVRVARLILKEGISVQGGGVRVSC